jgi:predicted Zn-dependent peptidase
MIHEVVVTQSKIATLVVAFDAGSRVESKAEYNPGIAHMLEHSIFKGTSKMNAMEIQKRIGFLGGRSNAFTSHDLVAYYITVPYENLDECMGILSDMVFNPIFPEEELLKEFEVVKEEEISSNDSTHAFIYKNFSKEFFGSHYIGSPVIGTQESISRFTRDEVARFHSQFCQRKDAVVSLASNLKKGKAKALLNKHFGRANGKFKKYFKYDAPSFGEARTLELKRSSIEHTYAWVCTPSLANDDVDTPAVELMNIILGSGMDSRLFEEVREKRGLVYGVSSNSSSWQNTGVQMISLSTREANLDEALTVVAEQVSKIKSELVTDEELQRAKNKVRSSFYSSLESSWGMAIWNVKRRISGRPTLDEYVDRVYSVSADDVLNVANRVFDLDKQLVTICRKEG